MFSGIRRPRVDVPEFTRCCFCLPLRYGLLAWSYIKIIGLLYIVYLLFQELSFIRKYHYDRDGIPPMLIFLMSIVIADMICTTVLIVGGHMKHQLLYKIYYYYSIVFLICLVLVWVAIIIDEVIDLLKYGISNGFHIITLYFIYNFLAAAPVVLLQTYVTLLVRSELRKLNNSNVQFENNVAMFVNTENESIPNNV